MTFSQMPIASFNQFGCHSCGPGGAETSDVQPQRAQGLDHVGSRCTHTPRGMCGSTSSLTTHCKRLPTSKLRGNERKKPNDAMNVTLIDRSRNTEIIQMTAIPWPHLGKLWDNLKN